MRFYKFFVNAIALVVLTGTLAFTANAEFIYGIQYQSIPDPNDPLETILGSSSRAGVVGLTKFDSATPGVQTFIGPFTGLIAGHTIRSIDFRPSTGELYAVSTVSGGTAGQLYKVNLTNAALTPVGVGGFTLAAPPVPQGTLADLVDIDFSPVLPEFIRIATGANLNASSNPVPNNYRLNPDTGFLVTPSDTNFNYVPGDANGGVANIQMAAVAYANAAGGRTTLYGWDFSRDVFLRIGGVGGTTPDTPESGRLHSIFTPPIPQTGGGGIGMDVGPSGILYLTRSNTSGTAMFLFTVDAGTGTQTLKGAYGANIFIQDIAVLRGTTAAGVTVSGRLSVAGTMTDRSGGLVNATVVLADTNGNSRTTTSGAGGTFTFDDVEVGRTYTLSVRSRGYTFAPQVISVMDSISSMTLKGSPLTGTAR